MAGGAFSPAVRAAALAVHDGRCAGCLARAVEVHHRAPRRAGGTSRAAVGDVPNALALCQRCHGLVESRREVGYGLGWLLHEPDPAAAWWSVLWGWRAWELDGGCWLHVAAAEPVSSAGVVGRFKALTDSTRSG